MSLGHWRAVGVLSVGLLALACGGDDGKDADAGSDEEAPKGPSTGAVCDSTLSYDQDIAPIMSHYCVTCHATNLTVTQRMGSPADHNFETQAGVLKELPHIDQEAGSGPKATNTSMPIAGFPAPTLAERKTLSAWIACQSAT